MEIINGAAALRYLTFKGLTVRFNGNQGDVTLARKSGTNNNPNFESDFEFVIWVRPPSRSESS